MRVYYILWVLLVGSCQAGVIDGLKKDKAARRAAEITTIKQQNTLLTSEGYSVGVYKQDLVNAAFFMSYIAADTLLYNKLLERTVSHTMQAIMQDIDGLIAVLERTKRSEDRFEERMAFAVYQGEDHMSVDKKKRVLFTPLRRYLNTHHAMDSVFDSKTLYALKLRWLFDRISCLVEQGLVVPPPSKLELVLGISSDPELRQVHESAYVYKKGELVPTKEAPYSATTMVKALGFMVRPFMALRAGLRTGHTSFNMSKLSFYNRWFGTGLPEWLFSQSVRTLLEFVELAGAVSFFNEANRFHWIRFVVPRRYELLRLLYAYRSVVEDPMGQEAYVHLIRDEIKDFVQRGYTRSSGLSGATLRQWWSSQGRSTRKMGWWFRYATLAILGLKSAHYI